MDTYKVFIYRKRRVRVVLTDDKEYFWVYRDVCLVLDVASPAEAFCLLKDDERELHNARDLFGDEQRFMCLNEKGLKAMLELYPLTAPAFARWLDILKVTNLNGDVNQPVFQQFLPKRQSK